VKAAHRAVVGAAVEDRGKRIEARESGDNESSRDDPYLKAVVLNLDTVLRSTVDIRVRYGFDAALLDTEPAGRPTRWLMARQLDQLLPAMQPAGVQ
jgi:hypothetical protein